MSCQLVAKRLCQSRASWQTVRLCSSKVAVADKEVKTYPLQQLPLAVREQYYPSLGDRDIVGHGYANHGIYIDDKDFPCPGVRFMANTPAIQALRQKELGDWKELTMEEKKDLYRSTFRQTYAEMNAPTGKWKRVLIGVGITFFFAQVLNFYQDMYMLPRMPVRMEPESSQAALEQHIREKRGRAYSYAAMYDYEKGEWKKKPTW